jgi:hypothetical protein
MNMQTKLGCAGLGAVALLSTACVANTAYRTCLDTAPGKPCSKPSVLSEKLLTEEFDRTEPGAFGVESPYQLSFIEFDDRGEMFDRRQLAAAVNVISVAKSTAPPGTTPVVVVFVHGWKNNASESSGNVWGFRQTLAALALQYKKSGQPFPPVVGVYIGWRGAVVSAPLLKEFTFFDRHGKSQNLPGPHMTEALIRIMHAAKGRDFSDESTISVLLGHSFGGAVLETALSETLAGLVLRAQQTGTPIQWPADLIMFLNEAQEATRSYQLIESLIANVEERVACPPAGSRFQKPALISVSSTGDSATRVAFPGAQSVARLFNSLRHYPEGGNAVGIKSQTSMFFKTTAHMSEFQSHIVGRTDDPQIAEMMKTCRPYFEMDLNGKFLPANAEDSIPRYVILDKPESRNRTPYWVFQLPPEIVPDHSTIFTAVFRRFLLSLLRTRDEMDLQNDPKPVSAP